MPIDLNADLGEGLGPWRMGDDETLMTVISSANVACGYHAGDPVTMDKTVKLARSHGVDVGAHPSYPDILGFGRRRIDMDLDELEKHVLYQLGALQGIAVAAGSRVTHFSPHGALGNLSCTDRGIAETLVRAVAAFDRSILVLVLPGTELHAAAERANLRRANLFLADRAYDATGNLVPRKIEGAVIKDHAAVLARVKKLLEEGTVTTIDGAELRLQVQSILVHGDTPGAVDVARSVRRAIEESGHEVAPLSSFL